MIYRSISPGRSCAIIFVATTFFCLHPRSIAAQDLESKPASTDHAHLAPCSAVHGDELQPTREDLTGNSLSSAPITAGQAQGQAQDPATPFGQQPNQLPVLPPTLTRSPLTGEDKFRIYIHKAFGPPAVILPALGTSYQMANPPKRYPKEWKDGSGAFGRIYGYKVAEHTSRETAQFLTGFLLQRILATNAPPAPTRSAEPSMCWRSPLSTRQIPAEVLSRRVTSLPLQRAVS